MSAEEIRNNVIQKICSVYHYGDDDSSCIQCAVLSIDLPDVLGLMKRINAVRKLKTEFPQILSLNEEDNKPMIEFFAHDYSHDPFHEAFFDTWEDFYPNECLHIIDIDKPILRVTEDYVGWEAWDPYAPILCSTVHLKLKDIEELHAQLVK